MAGMFFELFIVLTVLIVGLTTAGVTWKKAWPLLIASLFMILAGGVLMSDGIRYESGSTYDLASGRVTYDYNNLMPFSEGLASNQGFDLTVAIFANGYLYGGFALVVVAAGVLIWRRVAGVS